MKTGQKTLLGLIVVLFFLCSIVGIGYGYVNGIRNDGISKENQLTAQYKANQNELSAYISGFYEQVGIAQAATSALDQVLLDAVKGRYDKGGFGTNSPLFSAMVEAYPDVNQLTALWGKIQEYITSGRTSYKNVQNKLLDMLQSYDTWRESGLIKQSVVNFFGFPSNRLQASVGSGSSTVTLYGQEAEKKMRELVLTSDAINAYETGTMAPLQVPTKTSTP